eukprot:TRINITY_DN7390_c0_g1_i8.p1 TRINITY_DN7390_c0_g1~~TRINITY_DN7390_c0_g1_i8.p1  ORF type:complete len:576 (-),score=127.16 TRINITY_DN7390_c0_g1_i8:111-1769(-)
MSFNEARLAPLPSPFLAFQEEFEEQEQHTSLRTLKRSHSFSGYVPFSHLSHDDCQQAITPSSTAASADGLDDVRTGDASVRSQDWPDTDEEVGLGDELLWPDTDDEVVSVVSQARPVRSPDYKDLLRWQTESSPKQRWADIMPELDAQPCSPGQQGSHVFALPLTPPPTSEEPVVQRPKLTLPRRVSLEAALIGAPSSSVAASPQWQPQALEAFSPAAVPHAIATPTQCLSTSPSSLAASVLPAAPVTPIGVGPTFFEKADEDTGLAGAETGGSNQCVTTMMIKKIPTNVGQMDLLEELNISGFAGSYDFCYLPCNFKSSANKGFAFVNFMSPAIAMKFVDSWNGRARFTPAAQLSVSTADLQGLQANLKKWAGPRTASIRNPNLKPFILGGAQVEEQAKASIETAAPVTLSLESILHTEAPPRQVGQVVAPASSEVTSSGSGEKAAQSVSALVVTGKLALKKARAMLPPSNLEPTPAPSSSAKESSTSTPAVNKDASQVSHASQGRTPVPAMPRLLGSTSAVKPRKSAAPVREACAIGLQPTEASCPGSIR